ncbi:MAG: hypothetical protein ABWX60_02235 [Aeromicrobium sp.]
MKTFDVAVIPGDGVGGEVVAAGREVLDAVAGSSENEIELAWTTSTGGAGTSQCTGG